MLARLFCTLVLAAALVAVGVWASGHVPVSAHDRPSEQPGSVTVTTQPTNRPLLSVVKPPIGDRLYLVQANPANRPASPAPAPRRPGVRQDPIVVPNCRLAMINGGKQDVPSQREGVLLFIGVEVKDGENVPKEDLLPPVQVDGKTKQFRRLKEGDAIEANQLVAQVDDRLARADLMIKGAKLSAALADRTAAEKTKDEAKARWDTQLKLFNSGNRGATSLEDVRGAQLTYVRYYYEEISKNQAIQVAKEDVNQSQITVDMYQVRSKIPGRVKTIYKNPGEAVKALEPVLQVQSYDRLRAEGMVDIQYANALARAGEVVIEPTVRQNPVFAGVGHRLDITGVAVNKNLQNPLIVSSSLDGTALVWDKTGQVVQQFTHPVGVQAVACTPPGSEANLCLTGGADGVARLWDLDAKVDKPLREMRGHRAGIRCVAFSPDGKTCATGGEDTEIYLWETATGSQLYHIPGHRDWVTSLYFTPQSELISVSRDRTVRVWKIGSAGYENAQVIRRRSNEVHQLGVSPDGKLLLDEQGREMRVLSLPDLRTESVLANPSQASTFRALSIFSPDGRLVLTSSGSDGLLQLWKVGDRRSHEIRQLLPYERAPATCAAFAPDGSFVVAGIRDRKVYVWPMPSREEADQQIVAQITNIERAVESSESQVRVMAEFANPENLRLLSGDIVTLVAYPK
jgi:WD40 repeat protein